MKKQQPTQARVISGQEQPPRTQHIHAILYVEKTRHVVRLRDLLCTQFRRTKCRDTPTSDALWAGINALEDKCDTMLTAARDDGLLLMCWEGSRVDEITDAEEVAA